MGAYRLLIKRSAVQELQAIRERDRLRLAGRIRALSTDPRPPGCEQLSGQDRLRVRQGDYRVVYEVNDVKREVTIYKIGHRREVYR